MKRPAFSTPRALRAPRSSRWVPGNHFELLENGEELVMDDARIATRNTHGTGCTLSSAIASYLALGEELADAVTLARVYVRHALANGAQVRTGKADNGPLNHASHPRAMRLMRL